MRLLLTVIILFALAACQQPADISGRWDVSIGELDEPYPSWFEIVKKDGKWQGQFVGESGNARPIKSITIENDQVIFSLPPQYEDREDDLRFIGKISAERIEGVTFSGQGDTLQFVAIPAPALPCAAPSEWGEELDLLANAELTNWIIRDPDSTEGWKLINRVLINTPPSTDLISLDRFADFKLHIEVNLPEKGNSGIYLRGRYEVQVMDQRDQPLSDHTCGAVYGFIAPTENATKPAGEWNIFDITLIGRCVSVELNGKKIIDNREIPGITGGALDSWEGEPGPIMLQGDHGSVSYRNIIVTPAK